VTVTDQEWLAGEFEQRRERLQVLAYRMLGSPSEAEDAVQETWLRLSRADREDVANLGGWLTTVVSRVCLDMLRSRKARREDPTETPPELAQPPGSSGPEQEALIADAMGPALLMVLETLAPTERIAFVLHDLFGLPFDEIAPILGRSPVATRQLASRARRRVRGAEPTPSADRARREEVVRAFLAASRNGDFTALLTLLDPDVAVRADAALVSRGSEPEVRGREAAANTFSGRAKAARVALIDGEPGLAWVVGGETRVIFAFTIVDGAVTGIDMVADPATLAATDLEMI
jgi:RNA polymerase sigma factor (sigma-70 family)